MTQESKAIISTALHIRGKQKPGVMDIAQHSCLKRKSNFLLKVIY